ncbi:hypothetical protein KCP76_22540 [Salmonella enterica subsp. enterica serovar Weltevreden]|nr:hypothetical protein KCP76_22540 [Salmonella enterica subsp. enterica serovar Weltevreden]
MTFLRRKRFFFTAAKRFQDMKAALQTLCSTRLNSRPRRLADRLGNVVARYGRSDKPDASA